MKEWVWYYFAKLASILVVLVVGAAYGPGHADVPSMGIGFGFGVFVTSSVAYFVALERDAAKRKHEELLEVFD